MEQHPRSPERAAGNAAGGGPGLREALQQVGVARDFKSFQDENIQSHIGSTLQDSCRAGSRGRLGPMPGFFPERVEHKKIYQASAASPGSERQLSCLERSLVRGGTTRARPRKFSLPSS